MNGIIFGVEAPEITWNFFLRAREIGLLKDRHPGLYRRGRSVFGFVVMMSFLLSTLILIENTDC